MNEKKEINVNKSNKTVVVVLIALLLLAFLLMVAAFGIGFFVWKKYSDQKERQTQALEQQIRNLESAYGNSQNATNQSSNQPETQSASECPQTFTNEENLNKADWKTFTNTKYGYSFQYPKSWIGSEKQDDYTGLGSGADQQSFEWRSSIMTGTDYYGFKEDSHKNMTVGCANAKITYFSGDPTADPPEDSQNRLVLVEFEKNGIPHVILFSFHAIGASVSSDIGEMFDLILKTVEFKK
ncbi:MAG: hypothetical protein WC726_02520 [Parcubacteria group bacterium]|jgi:hypothetical protein